MAASTTLHQLIIVGNGFDLACGLKSAYTDFFSSRLQAVDSMRSLNEADWKKAVDDNHLTVWDFILKLEVGSDWCDVEKAIGNWVLPVENDEDEEPIAERFLGLLNLYPYADVLRRINEKDIVVETLDSDTDMSLRDVSRYIWHKAGPQSKDPMDRSHLLDFLRAELAVIEKRFAGYLWGQCNNSERYLNDSVSLLADIAFDGCHPVEGYDKLDTSVLSFNYTTPFRYQNRIVDEANVVNIHGILGREIIFGVDGKECMDDLDALPFTKTYRVASMGIDMAGRLYDTASTTGDSKTDTVKFFGHSLGEADYSYFQSLFDGVNLYGGNTRLVFYYRPWMGKDEQELHAETVRAVTRLLTTYGGTLDNRDHGKNLMHKLLLEGRLEIKQLMKRSW